MTRPLVENTYLIDPESGAEMARLLQQDRLITHGMGGFLVERADDFTGIGSILDIACGPGGWVQDIATAHPEIEFVGVDISQTMIAYAQAQAHVQGLKNARFLVMDAIGSLAFPDQSFVMVNGRFLVSFLHTHMWAQLVRECWRVLRPGGIIRLTESE